MTRANFFFRFHLIIYAFKKKNFFLFPRFSRNPWTFHPVFRGVEYSTVRMVSPLHVAHFAQIHITLKRDECEVCNFAGVPPRLCDPFPPFRPWEDDPGDAEDQDPQTKLMNLTENN